MKKVKLTIETDPNCYCKVHGSMPALLWGEIQFALNDYQLFERGKKGTRFDPWLKNGLDNIKKV